MHKRVTLHGERPLVEPNFATLELLKKAEAMANRLEQNGEIRKSKIYYNALDQLVTHKNDAYLKSIITAKTLPVTIDEFIEGEDFLNGKADVWPTLRETLRQTCPDIMAGAPPIIEVINKSTVGSGKSVIGKVAAGYTAYFLSCWDTPQLLFDSLNQFDPILITMQSISPEQTNSQLFEPFMAMFTGMRYARQYLHWDRDREKTRLELTNGVQVRKMGANPLKVLGFGVIHAHLDEASFMEVTQESKKMTARANNGTYDQAELVYNGLYKRRVSRFLTRGPNPGHIYLSSSVNYTEDFVDRRFKEVEKTKQKGTVLINYRQHDIKPTGFSGKTFRFLVGTNDYPPKILADDAVEGKDYKVGAIVEDVPIEYINEFRRDPEIAQRDLLGHPSTSISRFITRVDKIVNAVVMGKEFGLEPFVHNQNIVMDEDKRLPEIIEDKLPADRETSEYFVHVDLSRTSDRVGIAMAKVLGFTNIAKGNVIEKLPMLAVPMAITIKPSKVYPVDIADIRTWIMQLKSYYGFNIRSVTYDGFDSPESIQLLRKAGIQSYVISLDTTIGPYSNFRQALYEDRIYMVDNQHVKNELSQLELIIKGDKRKVNHPPVGYGKDGSDAVAGACEAASRSRVNRANTMVSKPGGTPVYSQTRREHVDRR